MSAFTADELAYLTGERHLGRLATVGADGMPHVGRSAGPTMPNSGPSTSAVAIVHGPKKFREVARTGRAAIAIDDALPPWQPQGIDVRGDAEALVQP